MAEHERDAANEVNVIKAAAEQCIRCKLCVKECAFLQKHGKPGEIFERFLRGEKDLQLPFECNLCGLCAAVCPKDINNNAAFLQMRQQLIDNDDHNLLPQHSVLCRYEKMGRSSLFTLHKIPPGCDTIFFPGCTLAGTRAETTLHCYKYLKKRIPDLGIVLDCCSRPSHDLGRTAVFGKQFHELYNELRDKGVRKVITACPSCLVTFQQYGTDFESMSVYEILAALPMVEGDPLTMDVTLHDTCVTRDQPLLHDAVRKLIVDSGLIFHEPVHAREKTLCCGEGAAAGFVAPEVTGRWSDIRKNECSGKPVITYCAGCSSTFGTKLKNIHLLDLLFQKKRVADDNVQVTRSPFTYVKRFVMKWILQFEMNKYP